MSLRSAAPRPRAESEQFFTGESCRIGARHFVARLRHGSIGEHEPEHRGGGTTASAGERRDGAATERLLHPQDASRQLAATRAPFFLYDVGECARCRLPRASSSSVSSPRRFFISASSCRGETRSHVSAAIDSKFLPAMRPKRRCAAAKKRLCMQTRNAGVGRVRLRDADVGAAAASPTPPHVAHPIYAHRVCRRRRSRVAPPVDACDSVRLYAHAHRGQGAAAARAAVVCRRQSLVVVAVAAAALVSAQPVRALAAESAAVEAHRRRRGQQVSRHQHAQGHLGARGPAGAPGPRRLLRVLHGERQPVPRPGSMARLAPRRGHVLHVEGRQPGQRRRRANEAARELRPNEADRVEAGEPAARHLPTGAALAALAAAVRAAPAAAVRAAPAAGAAAARAGAAASLPARRCGIAAASDRATAAHICIWLDDGLAAARLAPRGTPAEKLRPRSRVAAPGAGSSRAATTHDGGFG